MEALPSTRLGLVYSQTTLVDSQLLNQPICRSRIGICRGHEVMSSHLLHADQRLLIITTKGGYPSRLGP